MPHFEISISGYEKSKYEKASTELDKVASRLSPDATICWDDTTEKIFVRAEEGTFLRYSVELILEEIDSTMSGDVPTPSLNKVVWNNVKEWWDCDELELGQKRIEVCIASQQAQGPTDKSLELYEKLKSRFDLCDSIWKTCITIELLDSFNQTWRQSSHELSSEEFQRFLSLDSIIIDEKSAASAFYECGGLFRYHGIRLLFNSLLIPVGVSLS